MISYLHELVIKGGPKPDDYLNLAECFAYLASKIIPAKTNSDILRRVRAVLQPTLTLDSMQGFSYLKPHGYPGDYEIIDRICQNWHSPNSRLVRWDRYFHNQDAPKAVRNRKDYFLRLLRRLDETTDQEEIAVLNIGSGPGRDLYEYFSLSKETHIVCDCVDFDPNAIIYAKNLCSNIIMDRIAFHCRNAFRFRPSRKYALVWAGGVFGYLNDRRFKWLMKHLFSFVELGGELVISALSTNNPTRPYMELVGDWYLEYRNQESLQCLAIQSGINLDDIHIGQEPEGVNLFLHVKKTT